MCFPEAKFFLFLKSLQKSFGSEEKWNKLRNNLDSSFLPDWCMKDRFQISDFWVLWIPARLTQLFIPPRSKDSALCTLQCLPFSDKMLQARNLFCSVWILFSWHVSDAGLAKMLLPPACPVFSPRGRQGGIFPQLCKECLLRYLKVEIACKYTGCPSAWGIIYVLRRVSASRWWRMSTVNWHFPTFASPGAFGTGESTQGKQPALEERLLCRVRQ